MTSRTTAQPSLTDEQYNARFEEEVAAYTAMHPQLLERYEGQWVAVYGGRVIDADVDDVTLFDRVTGIYGEDTPILFHKVTRDVFADVTVGPILKRMAGEAGVGYTMVDGDQRSAEKRSVRHTPWRSQPSRHGMNKRLAPR